MSDIPLAVKQAWRKTIDAIVSLNREKYLLELNNLHTTCQAQAEKMGYPYAVYVENIKFHYRENFYALPPSAKEWLSIITIEFKKIAALQRSTCLGTLLQPNRSKKQNEFLQQHGYQIPADNSVISEEDIKKWRRPNAIDLAIALGSPCRPERQLVFDIAVKTWADMLAALKQQHLALFFTHAKQLFCLCDILIHLKPDNLNKHNCATVSATQKIMSQLQEANKCPRDLKTLLGPSYEFYVGLFRLSYEFTLHGFHLAERDTQALRNAANYIRLFLLDEGASSPKPSPREMEGETSDVNQARYTTRDYEPNDQEPTDSFYLTCRDYALTAFGNSLFSGEVFLEEAAQAEEEEKEQTTTENDTKTIWQHCINALNQNDVARFYDHLNSLWLAVDAELKDQGLTNFSAAREKYFHALHQHLNIHGDTLSRFLTADAVELYASLIKVNSTLLPAGAIGWPQKLEDAVFSQQVLVSMEYLQFLLPHSKRVEAFIDTIPADEIQKKKKLIINAIQRSFSSIEQPLRERYAQEEQEEKNKNEIKNLIAQAQYGLLIYIQKEVNDPTKNWEKQGKNLWGCLFPCLLKYTKNLGRKTPATIKQLRKQLGMLPEEKEATAVYTTISKLIIDTATTNKDSRFKSQQVRYSLWATYINAANENGAQRWNGKEGSVSYSSQTSIPGTCEEYGTQRQRGKVTSDSFSSMISITTTIAGSTGSDRETYDRTDYLHQM